MSSVPPHRTAAPRHTRRGSFWLPGEAIELGGQTVQRGAAFVEWEAPAEETGLLPVVLIHGGGGQGTEWQQTPDGRPGWAPLLVDRGHPVYVIDRPGYGRSVGDPQLYGATTPPFSVAGVQWLFAPPAKADAHTGWALGREAGEPGFDAVLAASGALYLDTALMNRLDGDRIVDLLDRIGRAVLIPASAGGPTAYLAADRRPELVAAIAGIETLGPAFKDLGPRGRLDWGMTASPVTYDPPISDSSELDLVQLAGPEENPAGNAWWMQAEPPRQLPNIAQVPIAIFSTDISDRHVDDEWSVAFLRQAGVDAVQIRFAEHGVTGASHGLMFEQGNEAALDVVLDWVRTVIV